MWQDTEGDLARLGTGIAWLKFDIPMGGRRGEGEGGGWGQTLSEVT